MSIQKSKARDNHLKIEASDEGHLGENADSTELNEEDQHVKEGPAEPNQSDSEQDAPITHSAIPVSLERSSTFEIFSETGDQVVSPPHSQQGGILISNSGTSRQDGPLQPFNLEQEMSFHGQIHHAQSNVLSQISFHSSEQFARYWSPGMANYGSTPFSLDEPAHRGSGNAIGPVSGYHLPTSSFQPDLCSHSSSRTQLPPMSPPQAHIPNSLGTGSGGSQFGVRSWTNWSPQNQPAMTEPSTGTHEIQFQGVLGQAAGSSTLYPGATTGSSYLIQPPSMPIQSPGFAGNMMMMYPNQFEMGDPISSRAVRMRMTMQDIAPASPNLQLGNWMSPASHGLRSPFDYPCSPTPAPRPIKNAVYDPMFETMGLPIDPHLRMFLASRDHHGKGPQL